MNQMLLIDDFEPKRDALLEALLNADNELISLTGLDLSANINDIEQTSQIMTWARLAGYAQSRLVNDSINGENRFFYTTRKQKERIQEHIDFIRSQNKHTRIPFSNIDQAIFDFLLDAQAHVSSKAMAKGMNTEHRHITWRCLYLTRCERISRRKDTVSNTYLYFLTDEQRVGALLNQGQSKNGHPVFTFDNLSDVTNRILLEANKEAARKRQWQAQLREAVQLLSQEHAGIEALRVQLAEHRERLSQARLKKEDLERTVALELSKAQNNSMALSERLSFLRNLKKRPALQGYALLTQIIEDYEAALALQRSAE